MTLHIPADAGVEVDREDVGREVFTLRDSPKLLQRRTGLLGGLQELFARVIKPGREVVLHSEHEEGPHPLLGIARQHPIEDVRGEHQDEVEPVLHSP